MSTQTNPNVSTMTLTATRFNNREYQLQRKNHFDVTFQENDFINSDLKFMLVNFPLPKETTESSDINYFNQTIKVAGKTTFDTTTMTLRDAIDYDTEMKFLQWRKQVYNPRTGTMGLAADYKCKAIVHEYTPNGEVYRTWIVEGCWPSGVDYGELTYDDGGEKQISVTITYDFAYRDEKEEE
jgi:hypothetical protein